MRDYRTITADEFMVESIEMKMRWLARTLRRKDKHEEIEQWVNAVKALNTLRQTFIVSSTNYPSPNTERLPKPFPVRKCLSMSAPNKIWWETNDDDVTSRSDTPLPVDLPKLKQLFQGKLSNYEGRRLPPCVELDEPPRTKVIIKGTGVKPPNDRNESSMDIDTRAGQYTAVVDNTRAPPITINKNEDVEQEVKEEVPVIDNEDMWIKGRKQWSGGIKRRILFERKSRSMRDYDYSVKENWFRLLQDVQQDLLKDPNSVIYLNLDKIPREKRAELWTYLKNELSNFL